MTMKTDWIDFEINGVKYHGSFNIKYDVEKFEEHYTDIPDVCEVHCSEWEIEDAEIYTSDDEDRMVDWESFDNYYETFQKIVKDNLKDVEYECEKDYDLTNC